MKHKVIYLLTDYKGFFGSKQRSNIYRGGMDLEKLSYCFNAFGYETKIGSICHTNTTNILSDNAIVLYTSSEDNNDYYKSFVEDVIYDLEQQGVWVIPKYQHLRAHNNKVAMELLRSRKGNDLIQTIKSKQYGTIEELKIDVESLNYPVVIKTYAGAMSRGVAKAGNSKELIKYASSFMHTRSCPHDFKELLRKLKYNRNYKIESFHRRKVVIQNLVAHLENDWKVLIYGKKCFVLFRQNKKGDFRASGSGLFEFRIDLPAGLLDYAYKVMKIFAVANISMDIGFDGETFHLIEFQFLYFGTTTLEKSPHYFILDCGNWNLIMQESNLEEVYTESIHEHILNTKD